MSVHMSPWGLAIGYTMLILPLAILLYKGVPLVGSTLISVARMTVQLLFVGFYLQLVFAWDHPLINLGWLVVMLAVADGSILRSANLPLRAFAGPLFVSLVIGTAIPLAYFIGLMMHEPNILHARYVIPIGGMILGNCLRANIIGLKGFYQSIRRRTKAFHMSLAQGARLSEAIGPYYREALAASLAPTVASMATIGLVALPGMMTGQILGGASPLQAVFFQIGIMIAIYTGTAITVFVAIRLTVYGSFDAFGRLRQERFQKLK